MLFHTQFAPMLEASKGLMPHFFDATSLQVLLPPKPGSLGDADPLEIGSITDQRFEGYLITSEAMSWF